MNKVETNTSSYTICPECQGSGKKIRRLRKKARLQNQLLRDQPQSNDDTALVLLKPHLDNCPKCDASGLIPSASQPIPDTENYPHLAIIGGGIGGVALAVACLHR